MPQSILRCADILLPNKLLNVRENHPHVHDELINPAGTDLSIYPEVIQLLDNTHFMNQLNGQSDVITIRVMPNRSLHIIHSPQNNREVIPDQDIDQIVILLLRKIRAVYHHILAQQENGPSSLPEVTAGWDITQTQLTTSHQVEQRQAQDQEEESRLEEQCRTQHLEIKKLRSARTENKNLQRKITRLKTHLRRKKTQLAKARAKILELNMMRNSLRGELHEANIQADNQRDKIQELEQQTCHLEAAHKTLKNCCDKMNQFRSQVERKLSEAQEEKTQLETQCAAQHVEIEELKTTLAAEKEQLTQLQTRLVEAERERNKAQEAYNQLEAQYSAQHVEIEELKTTLAAEKEQLTQLQTRLVEAERERNEAQEEKNQLETQCAAQHVKIEALKTTLAAEKEQFTQLQTRLVEAERERNEAQGEKNQLETQCAAQHVEIEELKTTLAAEKEQFTQLQTRLVEAERERNEAQGEKNQLETQCAAQHVEIEELKTTLAAEKEQLTQLQTRLVEAERERNEAQEKARLEKILETIAQILSKHQPLATVPLSSQEEESDCPWTARATCQFDDLPRTIQDLLLRMEQLEGEQEQIISAKQMEELERIVADERNTLKGYKKRLDKERQEEIDSLEQDHQEYEKKVKEHNELVNRLQTELRKTRLEQASLQQNFNDLQNSYEGTIRLKERDVAAFQCTIRYLRKELEETGEQLKMASEESYESRNKIKKLESLLKQSYNKLEERETAVQQLKKDLEYADQELKNQKSALRGSLSQSEATCAEMEEQLTQLQTRLAEAERDRDEAQANQSQLLELKQLQKRASHLETILEVIAKILSKQQPLATVPLSSQEEESDCPWKRATFQFDDLPRAIQGLFLQIEQLEGEQEQISAKQMEELERIVADERNILKEYKKRLDKERQEEIDSLEQGRQEYEKKVKEHNELVNRLRTELRKTRLKQALLQQNDSTNRHEETIRLKKRDVEALKCTIHHLRENLEETGEQLKTASEESYESRSTIKELESLLKQSCNKLEERETTVQQLKKDLEYADQELKNQKSALREFRSQSKAACAEMKEQLAQLQTRLAEAERERDEAQANQSQLLELKLLQKRASHLETILEAIAKILFKHRPLATVPSSIQEEEADCPWGRTACQFDNLPRAIQGLFLQVGQLEGEQEHRLVSKE